MARGIERRKIFKDDKDRSSFLERPALILEETQTQCYAWALIPNHFHLLLRTGATPLSNVMRRLMTGYAVTFNRRHRRAGHLFQNRYKSVICEEDPYLLELIRYIHLNPLRAGLVNDLKELDKYPWSGHSAILGRRKNPLIPSIPSSSYKSAGETKRKSAIRNRKSEMSLAGKTTMDVLLRFGNNVRIVRRRYRHFVKQGVNQGRRPELQGGGLVRSAGGNKVGLLGRKKEEREKGDARILGSGDFACPVQCDAISLGWLVLLKMLTKSWIKERSSIFHWLN
jgi:REP element-mobilizing transposase RayT